jgi:hypothetical protein
VHCGVLFGVTCFVHELFGFSNCRRAATRHVFSGEFFFVRRGDEVKKIRPEKPAMSKLDDKKKRQEEEEEDSCRQMNTATCGGRPS